MFNMKECPFCGSDETELSCGAEDSDGVPCAINCKGCGALGPFVICDAGATPLAMLTEAQEGWDQRTATNRWSRPVIYTLDGLFKACRENGAFINNVYVPARPLSGPWIWRVRAAWAVLRGRADAFTWPEGQ